MFIQNYSKNFYCFNRNQAHTMIRQAVCVACASVEFNCKFANILTALSLYVSSDAHKQEIGAE